MAENKKEISWIAPEFIHYYKNKTWFAAAIVIGLVLVGYFAFSKDFLTSVMFFLLFAMLLYLARMKPRVITTVLSARGLRLNDTIIPFQQIKSFWLVYDPPEVKTVNFETTAYLNRYLTVQLGDQDPVPVRDFLLEFLPEDLDREERLSDALSRKMRF